METKNGGWEKTCVHERVKASTAELKNKHGAYTGAFQPFARRGNNVFDLHEIEAVKMPSKKKITKKLRMFG
jgi:hypothetical protein